jgi:thiamine monophosphate synthase
VPLINDDIDLAARIGAGGAPGSGDASIQDARRWSDSIIGASVMTGLSWRSQQPPVSYPAFGSMFLPAVPRRFIARLTLKAAQ